jgi:hypothetical protein
MTLSITSVLTLVSMAGSAFQNSPRTSYLKAGDVWLLSCIAFTLVVLLEFCVVIYFSSETPGEVMFFGTGRVFIFLQIKGFLLAVCVSKEDEGR